MAARTFDDRVKRTVDTPGDRRRVEITGSTRVLDVVRALPDVSAA